MAPVLKFCKTAICTATPMQRNWATILPNDKVSPTRRHKRIHSHLPLRPHDNYCWDVASTKTVSHDGGGDCNGLANMLKYTLTKYNADTKKVFVTGTSSGAMMTNVMCAVYPDLIAAGSGYSGVAAGRLAGSPGSSPTTATPTCADGKINKTPFQWTSVVKSMYPTFNGTYSKIQLWHGTADNFVNYPKLAEEVTECSGVLGVSWTKNVIVRRVSIRR